MQFNATIKSDSAGILRGGVKCSLTASGLTLAKRKIPTLLVPVGTDAISSRGNVVHVALPDRQIAFAVQKFGSYQGRLADDVAGFLRAERPEPVEADYKLQPYLLALSLLPIGIMILTGGGALWGAIGGAVAMACLVVAQNDRMPIAIRVLFILAICGMLYAVMFLMVIPVQEVY